MAPHLWVRAEIKPQEHRTALTPAACKQLLSNGYQISVESSKVEESLRCYSDAEYEAAGCAIVEAGSWPSAPKDAFVFGVKELPEESTPLEHRHIFFGHAYKGQAGWQDLLKRFKVGGGQLLDLEFLVDDQGRRVAAFGYMAGFAGCFVGIETWCQQQLSDEPLPSIKPYPNEEALLAHAGERLKAASAKTGRMPRVHVMGALGRCGSGAVDLATKAGIPSENIIRWDMAETKAGGPFPTIMEADIFVNCIYLSLPIPPFIATDMLNSAERTMSVVVDVSADTTNPHNPLPFANKTTNFPVPTFRVETSAGPSLDVSTIDHLPTLLPKESSDRFCNDLMPTIQALGEMESNPAWARAVKLFNDKTAEMSA